MSRDPRAPVAMDSDIRTFTIRDPRANSNNAVSVATVAPVTTTAPLQVPSQAVQQPVRPQPVQQPAKPGTSSDTEKVLFLSV